MTSFVVSFVDVNRDQPLLATPLLTTLTVVAADEEKVKAR